MYYCYKYYFNTETDVRGLSYTKIRRLFFQERVFLE